MSTALSIVQRFHPKVKKVKDATKDIHIEVTKADVTSSKAKKHEECAMAVACKRKLHVEGVVISRSVAYVVDGDTAIRYLVPDAVQREVVSFDRGAAFETGEYKLNRPRGGKGLGENTDRSGSRGEPTAKMREPQHITKNVRTALGGRGAKRYAKA